MAPIYVKGGIWSNVEDEILKLSISKYGLNQWARVSSLLAKKTAKQCKARWNEWLNPNIRKIEWSREEDEKLLRLVKLLPTQWRSIASMVGRTATQCIDRYQQLLDEANGETVDENNQDLGLQGPGIESMAGVGRKIQVGDLHLNPESKPARPDSEEMDDEEKEMLSEARARLANTQGKKAKRKLRERMLDETRRIALLQKRRELKNAGINMKLKKKKKDDDKHIDYNAEIPVYQPPPPGFYDVSKEEEQNKKEQRNFESAVRKHGTKNVEFEKQMKKEKRNNRDIQATSSMESDAKLKTNEQGDFKRRKLVLPEPISESIIIDDHEIDQREEEDVGDADFYLARGLVSKGSKNLQSEEKIVNHHLSKQDQILHEVRQLQQRTDKRSSLYGDDLSKTTQDGKGVISDNDDDDISEEIENHVDFLDQEELSIFDIQSKLASLPTPNKTDYNDVLETLSDEEIVIEEEEQQIVTTSNQLQVDRGELLEQKKLEEQKLAERAILRRSQVFQRGLPIPKLKSNELKDDLIEEEDKVQQLINEEMVLLIRSDYCKLNPNDDDDENNMIPDIDESLFNLVKAQLKEEISKSKISFQEYKSQLEEEEEEEEDDGLPGLTSENPTTEEIQLLINDLKSTASKSSKLEKKIMMMNGGYLKRSESLMMKCSKLGAELVDIDLQLKTFQHIEIMEIEAIENIRNRLQESVDMLVQAEGVGQKRYDELVKR